MPRTSFAGHPTHPILVAFPIGLLFFGSVLDWWNVVSPDERREYAAYLGHSGGVVTAVAAAATGIADYVSLPRERDLRKTGLVHGVLNALVLTAAGINVWAHLRKKGNAVQCTLSSLEMAGLFVSSWYGASLVYEAGVRVNGLDPLADSPEYKLEGDDKIHDAFASVALPRLGDAASQT